MTISLSLFLNIKAGEMQVIKVTKYSSSFYIISFFIQFIQSFLSALLAMYIRTIKKLFLIFL